VVLVYLRHPSGAGRQDLLARDRDGVRDDGYPGGFLDINPSVPASGFCTDAPEFACGDPIDVTFGGGPFPDPAKPCGLLLHQNTSVSTEWGTCYTAGQSEGYTVRFTGPAPYWLPGSGGGSGSGSGGTGTNFFRNRTLMLWRGFRSGRTVYVGTCCPSGSGSGGGSVTVPCEPSPVKPTLTITFDDLSGFGCSIQPAEISYDPATGSWSGVTFVGGVPIGITLTCNPDGNSWTIHLTGFSGCTWSGTASPGFPLIANLTPGAGNTCCPSSTIGATVTQ
jgi:hypothetical protein